MDNNIVYVVLPENMVQIVAMITMAIFLFVQIYTLKNEKRKSDALNRMNKTADDLQRVCVSLNEELQNIENDHV